MWCSGDRPARLGKCAHELGRGLLWGLPVAGVAPLLALLGNIALLRLSPDSSWRRYPYNWQYCAGLFLAAAGVCGMVFFHLLTDDARQAESALCNGLYGWLTVVFVADIALCAAAAVLGLWYSVRVWRD
jgi:hypothetical protein